jgi:hypothetical protein
MRTRLGRILVAIALLAGLLAPGVAQAGAKSDIDFRIKAGKHGDSTRGSGLRCFQFKTKVDRTLRFQVLFTSGMTYNLNSADQFDWCKAMGITGINIHKNSIRLGWRWLPSENRMELGFYGYIKKQRISKPLVKVALNTWVNVEMRFHRNGLRVTAGGVTHEVNQSLGLSRWFPTSTWMLKTAYFGGNQTAPAELKHIRVRGIDLD